MGSTFLSLAVAVRAEPSTATESIKGALSRAGAVITSARRLGNQALVVGFELDPETTRSRAALFASLLAFGPALAMDDESWRFIDASLASSRPTARW